MTETLPAPAGVPAEYRNIGRRVPKFDAVHKTTGHLKFVGDIQLPRMLEIKILRSPHPHARIRRIDTSKAVAIPGVKAIITHEDAPSHPYGREFALPPEYMPRDNFVIPDKARYVGDVVAAVAATTPDVAARAVAAIEVEYEKLPASLDPFAAIASGAPRIHDTVAWGEEVDHLDGNVLRTVSMGVGDVEQGFADADVVIENTFTVPKQQQSPMERRCIVVDPLPDGRLEVWCTTQSIHGLRHNLARALGIPYSRINVHQTFLGGAFGARLDMNVDEPIAALLALKSGLPVRLQLTREEDMMSTSRHPATVRLKTGAKRDGTLVAHEMEAHVDTGAYACSGEWVTKCMGGWFMSMYRVAHQRFTGHVIYTNTPPAAGFRGFGNPQANVPVESHMDLLADRLGIDPVEIRLRNYIREGDAYYAQGPNVVDYIKSCGVEQILTSGAKRIGWDRRAGFAGQGDRKIRKGIGLGRAFHTSGCGQANEVSDILEYAGSVVKINEDGTANLTTALIDMGTGNLMGHAQIVAEVLGLRAEDVLVSSTDTDSSPYDVVTHASRSTYVSGMVAKLAAEKVRDRLTELAGRILDADPGDIVLGGGRATVRGTGGAADASVSIEEIARTAQMRQWGTIMAEASERAVTTASHFTCKFVEVSVDTETGHVTVDRVVAGSDVGQVINPVLVEGQIHGGAAQAFGYALLEEIQVDRETGRTLNPDYLNYKIFTSRDACRDFDVFFADTYEDSGPFGAKGIGESANNDGASAIVNAVANAIGVHIKDLPLTPEKVLRALGKL
ncbi:xanthine dehydrogenase family protein molybdopterin-binding subunit [Amycolatopsis jiangsuensis]|uniref:CO/xanthine dehydrogenase Mo-binding subunit n=1 Tax=Amycolatopsis jiangsuensis TaxID=1181879 RepID=A0A840IN60_9PSEU|nr:molybdopterin cofactor-binding domain-containing protein [Amycolatopsis jiangsuensis]MBB4683851.1 CO/xanthine dehydrogenase Mo-binding subunit [Amycolatopsis jiangsuensis]